MLYSVSNRASLADDAQTWCNRQQKPIVKLHRAAGTCMNLQFDRDQPRVALFEHMCSWLHFFSKVRLGVYTQTLRSFVITALKLKTVGMGENCVCCIGKLCCSPLYRGVSVSPELECSAG